MPLYEFQCENCENVTTIQKKIDERREPENDDFCPKCLQKKLKFCVGTPTIVGEGVGVTRKRTYNFDDRLKDIKKRAGKQNTIDTN